ncbi:MAG TPA: hypothetical protein VFH11_11855 [Gemmatimonadota bacterium]|nr:hypothetical protein [Gemmatimonadota bacterium]
MNRARVLVGLASILCACGGGDIAEVVRPAREPGELALPPSANAPRVSRDASAPDTFRPDSIDEFEVMDFDSFPMGDPLGDPLAFSGSPDPAVESVADSYRRHYGESLRTEGSSVRGRIDRELQREAELRTAQERGYPDWTSMIEEMSAEQRARLVDMLNETNVELARDLHGSVDEDVPAGAAPTGTGSTGTAPAGTSPAGTTPPGE